MIPIVGIVMGTVIAFFYLLWSHREKVRLIERGLYEARKIDLDTFCLLAGLLFLSVGAVLSVLFIVIEGASYALLGGLLPFAAGISLLFSSCCGGTGTGHERRGKARETSDEEAIGRVLDGDTEAFAVLVRRHTARIMTIGNELLPRR